MILSFIELYILIYLSLYTIYIFQETKNDRFLAFKNDRLYKIIVSFFVFFRRFQNKTIVFQQSGNDLSLDVLSITYNYLCREHLEF